MACGCGTCGPIIVQPDTTPDHQVLQLCDLGDESPGAGLALPTPFLRMYAVAADGTVTTKDTELDGTTPYTVTGTVTTCAGTRPEEESPGEGCERFLREECRWDDVDGDGIGDTRYVDLLAVDSCTGALTSLGTYAPGLTGPYTPVAPVENGPVAPAPAARGVQAHRLVLPPGGSWDAGTVPLLQAVTLVARGTATVTTADGPSDLVAGESIGWSVARDADAFLVGPLLVTAGDGPVAVSWTAGVQL